MESFSARVIESFLARSQSELAFYSTHFAEALAEDLKRFPVELAADPTGVDSLDAARQADVLFNALRIPIYFAQSPSVQIEMWERTLTILRNSDERRYEALHKGTPFYFLGIASYLGQDFERALFYMDCALDQDCLRHGPRWYRIPSGMFVRLDDGPETQAGRVLVCDARNLFESCGNTIAADGGTRLSLDGYRARLVNYAIQQEPELRSVVTAFLSFLLEIVPRLKQLALAPVGAGTGEPFFLHLFKGAVLFETLLRASSAGRSVVSSNPGATLKNLLKSPAVFQGLMLNGPPQGFSVHTFADVLSKIQADAASGPKFNDRAIQATWALRNATGHNLAWPMRPAIDVYKQSFILVLGSIMLAINNLYQEHMLETGTA
jgi:hypothetical protein